MAVFLPQSKSRMGAAQTGYTAPRPNPAQSFAAESAKPGYGGYTKPVQQPTRPPMYGSKPMPQKPPMAGGFGPPQHTTPIGPVNQMQASFAPPSGGSTQHLPYWYRNGGGGQPTSGGSYAGGPIGGRFTSPGMSDSTLASAMARLFGY